MKNRLVCCGGLIVLLLASATSLTAQGRIVPAPDPSIDSVTLAPGPRYQASGFEQWLLGEDWRELWQIPITVPVLDIGSIAGGLEPVEEGGNRQSITLHFEAEDGSEWIFRSIDKYPEEKLEIGGLAEELVQDQISSLHPAGQLVLPPMLDALDILHVEPRFYVMPDDPRLGEFRERFAGMIGALEEKANERPDDQPGTFGSRKTVGVEEMLERLEDTPEHRIDQRELLRARLFDFIIGDTDRATDQWRWSRFPHPEHPDRYLWRPVPRDRDWAFISGDGALVSIARMFYPKLVPYGPEHASVKANTFTAHVVDRNMLTELEREDFEAEVRRIQTSLTDAVIADAVGQLPPEYPEEHAGFLAESIRSRRDALRPVALELYEWLATEVDVRGTDLPDYAEIVRGENGDLTVTLWPRDGGAATASLDGAVGTTGAPYYQRVFHPEETREVRVFLHGDDDLAVVRGPSDGDIRVRVIGGGSDDVLADSTSGVGVHFYDARGENTIIRGRWTDFDDRGWDPPPTPEGVRLGSDWAPDWGGSFSWEPVVGFGEYAGVVVGFGPSFTDYGFRRLPHHRRFSAAPLYAIGANRFGARVRADYRPENSLHSFELDADWKDFDAIRWFGLGNETPLPPEELSLVPIERVRIAPAAVFRFGTWRAGTEEDESEEGEGDAEEGDDGGAELSAVVISDETPSAFRGFFEIGPIAQYVDPRPRAGSPFAVAPDVPTAPGWEAGLRAELGLQRVDRPAVPRSGFRVRLAGEGYPAGPGAADEFGQATAEATGYLPLPLSTSAALRVGGSHAFGSFPAWHAAAIGGGATLRGFEYQRYAGESAAWSGAELRVPIGTVEWITKGQLGVLGLVDVGRVWVDGESPGGWHTGYGGGVWFASAGRAISVQYATGERDQIYISLGMPF